MDLKLVIVVCTIIVSVAALTGLKVIDPRLFAEVIAGLMLWLTHGPQTAALLKQVAMPAPVVNVTIPPPPPAPAEPPPAAQ